ncbi:thymidylate synthase [Anaerostipes faecalis]|uniref:thymidylate synthase n=1 Tax=Anaerostipes faecalis TaxID=2738446 RepID=UPI003F0893D5
MIKDKIYYLFDLCMEAQRGKDGNIEPRVSKKWAGFGHYYHSTGPTVFFDFSGHTAELEISIYRNGWLSDKGPDEKFEFYINKEINNKDFEHCKTVLEEIVRNQKEQEEE